jgi:hypothetical protein
MSNIAPDHLFSLIKSLGKAEKRHFKIYSKKHVIGEGNIYVRLFDAIDKQKKYNEQALRKGKRFHDLPAFKNWLYNAILRSMADYHSSIGIDTRDMINYIEILFEKSLFSHCIRQIRKAKKIIKKNELFEEWLEVLNWEYKIAAKKFDIRAPVLEEEKRVLSLLTNQKKYRDIANLFLVTHRKFELERNPDDMKAMENLLGSALLKDERLALTFKAKQNFYDCHSLFAFSRGNYKRSYHFRKKIIDLHLAHPEMASGNSASFLVQINNFLGICTQLRKYDEMLICLRQLEEKTQKLKSPSDRATVFFFSYHLLNYHIYTGSFNEAKDNLKRIENELIKHEGNLNQIQKILLYAVIAQVYFGLGHYKRCLFWLNKIMDFGEATQVDIEYFTRLFYLIAHYEAKSDPELMGSLLRSTYRLLSKYEHVHKFESNILDFFRQHILRETKKQNMKELFSLLKRKLEKLVKDPYENRALNYFDYISWLESKIENRPFAEVVRRKGKYITGSN